MEHKKLIISGIIICCVIIIGIKLYEKSNENLSENYIETNAEITFVGRTGTGINTKAKLEVNYSFEDKIYRGFVTRVYKRDGYYKKGDTIKIYINKSNEGEIK